MKDIFAEHEIMSRLRERPCLYLGKKSISNFKFLILGYDSAYEEIRKNTEPNKPSLFWPELSLFMQWLAWKYRIHFSLDWRGMLLLLHDCDEEVAFDAFWKEWDEFCLIDESVIKNNFMDENGKVIHLPDKLWKDFWERHHSDDPDEAQEIWQAQLSEKLDVYIKHPR